MKHTILFVATLLLLAWAHPGFADNVSTKSKMIQKKQNRTMMMTKKKAKGKIINSINKFCTNAADGKPCSVKGLKMTFNECKNGAIDTCSAGVESVDYDDGGDKDKTTGSCNFTCLKASN